MATMSDGDGEVHRIGFTLLKGSGAPKHGPFRANIVFVHGLRGCPRRTWEETASTTPPTIFWPDDFLANDLPEARIWTYGYNADVIGGLFQPGNGNSISHHGRDLSVQIEREVLADNADPVLFVAHSLGGIIVKDAITRSQTCQERCRLVVFLGTPHRGSDTANWGIVAANLVKVALQTPNQRVLEALKVDSEVLDNIQGSFNNILYRSAGRIKVHSFQEARPMTGIKGLSGKVVNDFSSKLDLPQPMETVESMDADHRQMARCASRTCPQYRAILGVLKVFVRAVSSGAQTPPPQVFDPLLSRQAVGALHPVADHPLRPCHCIPMPRNRRFVGRQAVLETLKQKLFVDDESPVSALVGLGGVGKTQVALQLAYWAKENKPELSIFWVPALSDSTFRQACADIVKKLDIGTNGDDDPRALLRQHLSSADAGEWLLIVDNADDEALLFGENSAVADGLINFLPQSERGRTLITTRSGQVADNAARGAVVHLGEMSFEDAMSHLEKSLSHKDVVRDTSKRDELLIELERLPLAITQAAAYLNQNQTSITEYLGLLRGTPQELISLMSYEFRDNTGYSHSKNAIATTWLVSFEQIRRSDPVAADLLTFISFIQPKAIPRSLLPPFEPKERMIRAIGALCAYSFLSNRGEDKVFDMHSLVHMAAQIWVSQRGLAAQEAEKAIRHVEAVFPGEEHEARFLWREYMPHALKLLEGREGHNIREKYDLFQAVGNCLRVDGRIKEAVKCFEHNYQWRRENFSKNDDGRLWAEHHLAHIYSLDGQAQRALELLEGVVKIREKKFPRDHADRLASQHELAGAYLANGEVKKAIDLLEVVVRIWEKVIAEDHPDRLASQHELAAAYLKNEEIKKAIDLLEVVIGIEEKVLAEDDTDRLVSQHELARAYLKNGEVKKAIDLLEVVVGIQEKVLAEYHLVRLTSQHELARAYLKNGEVKKATDLLEVVVGIQEKVLAEDHPDRLASQRVLAKAYLKNGEVKKAVALQEVVVGIREKVLAEDHPSRLRSQQVLARAFLGDGQVDRAIELLEHVVKVKARMYDESNPRLQISQEQLAKAYAMLNRGQDVKDRPGDAVVGEDEEGRGHDADGLSENAVAGDTSESCSSGVGKGRGQ